MSAIRARNQVRKMHVVPFPLELFGVDDWIHQPRFVKHSEMNWLFSESAAGG
jgi:hypothetical protein